MTSVRMVLPGFLFLAMGFTALPAAELEGGAQLTSSQIVLAEPITLEVCLSVAHINENAVVVSSEMLMTLRMNGPMGPCKKARNIQGLAENPGSLWMVPITLTKESPRWSKHVRLDMEFVLQGPGDYTVTIEWLRMAVDARAKSKALSEIERRFPGKAPFFEENFYFLRSLSFRVETPIGLDKKAYEAANRCPMCDPAKILKDFPTSTYAAYFIWESSGAEGLAASDLAKVAEALTSGMGLMGEIWVPVPGARDKSGLAPLSGQAAVEWRQKWFGIVLKSHPDIWFADALRLKLAVDQAALRNYQAAQADLEAIAKEDKARMAMKAKEYLSLMKQKGWIKE